MLLFNIINVTAAYILTYFNNIYASYKNLSKNELLWTYRHPIENININYDYLEDAFILDQIREITQFIENVDVAIYVPTYTAWNVLFLNLCLFIVMWLREAEATLFIAVQLGAVNHKLRVEEAIKNKIIQEKISKSVEYSKKLLEMQEELIEGINIILILSLVLLIISLIIYMKKYISQDLQKET